MPNRPVLTGNLPPTMHAFDSNASTHNIKTERVLVYPIAIPSSGHHLLAWMQTSTHRPYDAAEPASMNGSAQHEICRMSRYCTRQILSIMILYDNCQTVLVASDKDRHHSAAATGVEPGTTRAFSM